VAIWYFNIQVDIVESAPKEGPPVAIELGLKYLARLSDSPDRDAGFRS
jgi:hypothetical protein